MLAHDQECWQRAVDHYALAVATDGLEMDDEAVVMHCKTHDAELEQLLEQEQAHARYCAMHALPVVAVVSIAGAVMALIDTAVAQ